MKTYIAAAIAFSAASTGAAEASTLPSTSETITYHRANVDGVGVFYREAGPKDARIIVLLHGFPSSSRMFESLIPLLATRYHVIAPDYPGFGQSDAPPPAQYAYTFDHLADTTSALLDQLGADRYSLYLQDYGGPVGFRILLAHPERVQALIIQNANAYREGLGAKWKGIAEYWAEPKAHPEIPKAFTSLEAARIRHQGGSPHPERYDPALWEDEYRLPVAARAAGDPGGAALRLPHQCRGLSGLAGMAAGTQASDSHRVGRLRRLLHRGGGRSV